MNVELNNLAHTMHYDGERLILIIKLFLETEDSSTLDSCLTIVEQFIREVRKHSAVDTIVKFPLWREQIENLSNMSHRETLKRELKNRFRTQVQFVNDPCNLVVLTVPETQPAIDVMHHCERRLNILLSCGKLKALMKSTHIFAEKEHTDFDCQQKYWNEMMSFASEGNEILKYKKKSDPSRRWLNVTNGCRFAWKANKTDEFERNRSCNLGKQVEISRARKERHQRNIKVQNIVMNFQIIIIIAINDTVHIME